MIAEEFKKFITIFMVIFLPSLLLIIYAFLFSLFNILFVIMFTEAIWLCILINEEKIKIEIGGLRHEKE